MSDSGRLLVPFSSQAIDVLSPQFGAKGDGVTLDTGAVQAAVTAAAARSGVSGITDVWLPSGYGFKLGQINVASGVRVWAYGATIIPDLANITNGLLSASGNIQRFHVRGGTWVGAGTETQNQCAVYTLPNSSLTDCVVADAYVTGWKTAPFYLRNYTRLNVVNNTLVGTGLLNVYNNINLVTDGGAASSGRALVRGNLVDGCGTYAINAVFGGTASGPYPVIIAQNICIGAAAGGGTEAGNISVEVDAAITVSDFLIADNDVTGYGAGLGSAAIQMAGGGSGGNVLLGRIIGNRCLCLGASPFAPGIANYGSASEVEAHNNRITTSRSPAIQGTFTAQSGNKLSSGPMFGRATLVAGTVTVNTAEILAGDNVLLTVVVPGGTRGEIQLGTIVAGTSFVINSIQPGTASTLQTLDTSTVYWRIDH